MVDNVDDVVVQLRPVPESSITEDVLAILDEVTSGIKSGEIDPSHLIIGWGHRDKSFTWDAVGIDKETVIGHLYTYATKLAMEDE